MWGNPRNDAELALLLECCQHDEAELVRAGVVDPDAQVVRMIFLHNPFAQFPIDFTIAGPHDEHWSVIDHGDHGTYEVVAEGRDCMELPDRWM